MQARTLITIVAIPLAMLWGAVATQARLIAYEGCDYDVSSDVTGLNGGLGWAGAWQRQNAEAFFFEVVPNGLTYADGTTNLAVRGRAFRGTYNSYNNINRGVAKTEFAHLLTNDASGSAYGKAGTTNWIAFLAKLEGANVITVGHFGVLQLRPAQDNWEKLWIGARDLPWAGVTNLWSIGGFGAPYTAFPNAQINNGETVLLVVRVVYGRPTIGLMEIALWKNPSLAGEPSLATAVTNYVSMTYGSANRHWDRIALGACMVDNPAIKFTVDELRIGETFRDVCPRTFDISMVDRPVNIAPAHNAQNVALPVTIQGSAFSSGAPGDTHVETKVTFTSGDGVVTIITTGGLTTFQVPAGILKPSTRYTWSVQYRGSSGPLFSDPSAETTFTTAPDGSPMLLAYDGAAYGETPFPQSVHNKEGGSGWLAPWKGAWVADGFMRAEVLSPGLFYQFPGSLEYLLSTNNRFRTSERGLDWQGGTQERILGASRMSRQLGTDGGLHLLTPGGKYGKVGTTNWISFLARYEGNTPGEWFGVALNSIFEDNFPYQFVMGKPIGATTWGVMGRDNAVNAVSSVSAVDGNTVLLVTRLIHGNPDTTVHMWINPQTRVQPAESSAQVITNVPWFEFSYMDFVSVGSPAPLVGIDELRFGTDWSAVVPAGPAPQMPVGTPTNVTPANGAVNVSLTPTIAATAFNGAGPGDAHIGTEVQFISLGLVQSVISTTGMTSLQVPAGILQPSTRYTWRVRYLGTNTPNWSEWSAPTTFTTVRGEPRLMAYDGAAYVPTNILGGRAGGFGWGAAWQAQNWDTLPPGTYYFTQIAVTNPGLEYGDLIVTNNQFMTTPYAWTYGAWGDTDQAWFSRARRLIGLDGNMHLVNANNTFGKPGTTNWVSFLARYDSGSLGEYGIDFAINNEGNNEGLLAIGCVPGTGLLGAWVPGTALQTTSTNSAMGGRVFIVARLIFGETEDTLHVWVNPALGVQPSAASATVLSGIPHVEFDRLGLRAASVGEGTPAPFVMLDEVRLGETWESVTPIIPEPVAVLGLVGALVCYRIRQR
ncbi:MAG: hypothetical protein N2595_09125 [bacterium]|nr:hypothetical protein [bacterium]